MEHTTQIKSFYDDERIKNAYLERLNAKYEADRHLVTVRKDWNDYIYLNDHKSKLEYINPIMRYKIELGLPYWLYDLQRTIIYWLDGEEGREYPRNVIKTIHVGSDLSLVRHRFIHWCIFNLEYGYYLHTDREGREDLSELNDLHKTMFAGEIDRKKRLSLQHRLRDKAQRLIRKNGVTARNLLQAFNIYQSALGCPTRTAAWAANCYLQKTITARLYLEKTTAQARPDIIRPAQAIIRSAHAKKLLELLNEATSKENFMKWDMLEDNYN
jgi:hypothetical protein